MANRTTGFMDKRGLRAAEFFHKIVEDDEVSRHWSLFAYAMLERLGLQHLARRELATEFERQRESFTPGEEEPALLSNLINSIEIRLPEVYSIFEDLDPSAYHLFTLVRLAALAPDERAREALHQATEALRPMREIEHLPGNPLSLREHPLTGKLWLTDMEEATAAHFIEIHSYLQSQKTARSVGRPKGLPKPKKSGKPRLDPELGLRVHQCKLDLSREGKRRKIPVWEQIARQVLGIKNIPTDRKARDRLRKKIDALNALGARLYRKKSGK